MPTSPDQAGVYFLYQDSHCVYVGEAASLRNRLKTHEHIKRCNKIGFMLCDPYQRKRIETYYIGLIDPPLNKTQRVFERRENRNSDGVSRVKRVFNAIKKHGKVSVSKLHRESWKSSSARDFDRLLDRMERWNLITREKLPTTGRPVVIVSLCERELTDGR
jgi:hypothetical protein